MEENYKYLLAGISIDTSRYWGEWDWKQVSPITSYNHARLEEYRDSVVIAYRLYNRIGLEHLRKLLRDVSRNAKILDAGGGTGRKAIPLAKEGFQNITIMDHAAGWLQLAKEKAEIEGVKDKILFVESDICNMHQIADESFDFVIAMGGVLSYCGNTEGATREMNRVLKPCGKMLADGIHGKLGSMHLFSQMGLLDSLEKIAYKQGNGERQATYMPEELEDIALKSRFENVQVWSEFMFLPDDKLRIGADTKRWEQVIIDLEMKYYKDPRYLGAGMLMLYAEKQ